LAAGSLDGGSGDLGVGGELLGILDGFVADDPVGLRHGGLRGWGSRRIIPAWTCEQQWLTKQVPPFRSRRCASTGPRRGKCWSRSRRPASAIPTNSPARAPIP